MHGTFRDPEPSELDRRHRGLQLMILALAFGAVLLLHQSVTMLSSGLIHIMAPWVAAMVVVEALLEAGWLGAATRWTATLDRRHGPPALLLAACSMILHGLRMGVFAIGRLGPWPDLDIRPGYRGLYGFGWETGDAAFAAAGGIAALAGLCTAAVCWRRQRTSRR